LPGERQEIDMVAKQNERFRDIFIKDIGFVSYEGSTRVMMMVIIQIVAVSLSAYLVFNNQMNLALAVFTLTYLQLISSQIFTLGEYAQRL